MITTYIVLVLILILNALTVQRGKPITLVICMEMLALFSIIMWLLHLNSRLTLATIAISFWLMIFIIVGATMALVLLSVTSDSTSQSLRNSF